MLLELNEIAVSCIIGERPEERLRLQTLSVSLRLELDDAAASSDALEDTVDYAALSKKIRERLVAAKCQLIERAAAIAAETALAEPKVRAAEARVEKFGAVAGLKSAAATVRTVRHA